MPTGFIYKCNNCGYAVTLSGLWEFYIDEFGLRRGQAENGSRERAVQTKQSLVADAFVGANKDPVWFEKICPRVSLTKELGICGETETFEYLRPKSLLDVGADLASGPRRHG